MKHLAWPTLSATLLAGPAVAADFDWQYDVRLRVGESAIVAAARADCGKDNIPSWKRVSGELPRSSTGRFADGGTGTVRSGKCGGDTPARGILFRADQSGSETLKVYGERIKITVE